MLEVQTLDPASYYRFRDELDEAGFTTNDGGRTWTGPIAEPLRDFTDSDRMSIVFRDGWPHLHPELEVPGMAAVEHVNARGYVCLWACGDVSQSWRTLAGWRDRIAEWCKKQQTGFLDEDATMDAHLYFEGASDAIATLDLETLGPGLADGDCGQARGSWHKKQGLLEIRAGSTSGGGVRGTWFYRDEIEAPPTTLEKLEGLLTDSQRTRLRRVTDKVARGAKRRQFIILVWGYGAKRNALVLVLSQALGGRVEARSAEFAPSDPGTLLLRAGEDAKSVAECNVVVFGAGSVGSHLALLLAESGLGTLTIVDGERLRPGNVVRHAAPASQVGALKVQAVAKLIAEHAPWTEVAQHPKSPWSPVELRQLIEGQDLVVDATGSGGFADQLSVLTTIERKPLVTAALYRRGYVARVQRQADGDTPLGLRDDPGRYPTIPRGPAEEVQLEPGCSAAVNQASPRAVVACASLAAEVVVDALLRDCSLPDEITDIYRPLEEAPFECVGRLFSG